MAEESGVNDAYGAALAQLYAQRDQITQAITLLESLRGGSAAPIPQSGGGAATTMTAKVVDGPGALLGMSIVDAAKKLLEKKRQPLRNPEFAALFKEGGLVLNSKEPANTIGSVLTRRFAEVGDVVRVERGTWGLKEWYPNRSFKKDAKADDEKGEDQATQAAKPRVSMSPVKIVSNGN
jgi:hypothetical protein